MTIYFDLLFFRVGFFYLPIEEESTTSRGSWRWLLQWRYGSFCFRVRGWTLHIQRGRYRLGLSYYRYPRVRIDWTLMTRSAPMRGPWK